MSQSARMPRVLNQCVHGRPSGAVYVGRPSIWGNPFPIGPHATRDQVINEYERWLDGQPQLLARLGELRGRDLVCWCAPRRCHADVLLRRANGSGDSEATSVPATSAFRPSHNACLESHPASRPVVVRGRIVGRPRQLVAASGTVVAGVTLDCTTVPSSVDLVDVTVWGVDAMPVLHGTPGIPPDDRLPDHIREQHPPRRIEHFRPGREVVVAGHERPGAFPVLGCSTPSPFGVVAERIVPASWRPMTF